MSCFPKNVAFTSPKNRFWNPAFLDFRARVREILHSSRAEHGSGLYIGSLSDSVSGKIMPASRGPAKGKGSGSGSFSSSSASPVPRDQNGVE